MEDQIEFLIQENDDLKKRVEELVEENESLWFMLEEYKNAENAVGQTMQNLLQEVLEEQFIRSLKPVGDA
jgi:regulator of replication initiation timing